MAAADAETVDVVDTMMEGVDAEGVDAKQRTIKKHKNKHVMKAAKDAHQSVLCACKSGRSFFDCHARLFMPKARFEAEAKKCNTNDGKIEQDEVEQDEVEQDEVEQDEVEQDEVEQDEVKVRKIKAPKIKKAKVSQEKVTGANDAKPVGLAYRENVIGKELRNKILDFLVSISEEEWQVLKSSIMATKKRRIGYGRKDEKSVPEELRDLLPAILASIMESMNDVEKALLAVYKNDYRFTINRYLPGMNLGLHYDTKAGEDAIVMGFTIGTTDKTFRSMKFQNKDGHVHPVITRDNSVYIFYGDAYTDWKHGSSPPTKGVVYSITIRANC